MLCPIQRKVGKLTNKKQNTHGDLFSVPRGLLTCVCVCCVLYAYVVSMQVCINVEAILVFLYHFPSLGQRFSFNWNLTIMTVKVDLKALDPQW